MVVKLKSGYVGCWFYSGTNRRARRVRGGSICKFNLDSVFVFYIDWKRTASDNNFLCQISFLTNLTIFPMLFYVIIGFLRIQRLCCIETTIIKLDPVLSAFVILIFYKHRFIAFLYLDLRHCLAITTM